MAKKSMAKTKLERAKQSIETYFEESKKQIFTYSDLRHILKEQNNDWQLKPATRIGEFINYLLENTQLKKATLPFPSRTETRYIWGKITEYKLALSLKPNSYLTHQTAVYIHGLTSGTLANIYVNHEQSLKRSPDRSLRQDRIDSAFKKPVRRSKNRAQYNNKIIHILNGMYTNNYGVDSIGDAQGDEIRVADIERTLIDIAVRPIYSGGVHEVLKIYREAKDTVSIGRLVETLDTLNYIYPYHQAIGFYIESAGVYERSAAERFHKYGLEYDFYLTHQMIESIFSSKWRLYYPRDLIEE